LKDYSPIPILLSIKIINTSNFKVDLTGQSINIQSSHTDSKGPDEIKLKSYIYKVLSLIGEGGSSKVS
jgi:hypothetical protein